MLRLLILSIIQAVFFSGGQVLLKFATGRITRLQWTWAWWGDLLTNWWLLASGICMGVGTVMWMYILKHWPFSQAYPMLSLSYIISMIAAMLIFHEQISLVRWLGVLLILTGCVLVAR
ncbi:MAG: EamA family transporter [Bacteroidales bacterium]|nr:EamA family transporter [Bacteroidales bacterium]